MSDVTIRYSKNALKFLSKLDKKSVDRIRGAINGLKNFHPLGDIKVMQGYQETDGSINVIFEIDIDNRGDLY